MPGAGAAFEQPGLWRHGPPARVEIRREGGWTTAVVHASVKPIVQGVLAAWLGAWVLGELVAARLALAAAANPLPFFRGVALFFLAGWTVMGAFAAHALLWCYRGTEELSTDGVELTFRRQAGGLGRTRRFRRDAVEGPNIRLDFPAASAADVPPGALVRLAFHTRWSTYRLSASLRYQDAQRVVAALAVRPGTPAAAPGGGPRPPPRRPTPGPPPLPPR